MSDEDTGDKPHEPTQRKLEKAREKGEIPRSQDISVAASYAGLVLAATTVGATGLGSIGTSLMVLLDRAEEFDQLFLSGAAAAPMMGLMGAIVLDLAPLFLIPAAVVLLVIVSQRAFLVTPSKIAPKMSRISILQNAKNKFGRNGLFEFAKSFVKLSIYSVILGILMGARLPEMAGTVRTSPGLAMGLLMRLCVEFMMIVLAVSLAIGGVDFLWQRAEHMRKNRMSDKDMRDEHKEAEGDPHMKGERRQRAQEIAMSQMMADVPKADVIITNPTHYAVALQWSRLPGEAPVCVAKGVDEIAATIRQIAQESGVPIHRDPPTARALHATTGVGDEIDPAQYRAVASAIRFADQMRVRRKKGWK
ncbi:flagellar biosynthesis protein FlhB [Pseudooceanicola sp. MF1-13]|uniref:EscU/YscU/HrcU family type III secretion system export apparatus switch protein n=1 Tax=Pseudooceanicola sp. MF1-13 TaxID=3379095 RepID=UPI0038915F03